MQLIECDCGHRNHPTKGKPKAFRFVDDLIKYLQCGGCKKIMAIQSVNGGPWKRMAIGTSIQPNPSLKS